MKNVEWIISYFLADLLLLGTKPCSCPVIANNIKGFISNSSADDIIDEK